MNKQLTVYPTWEIPLPSKKEQILIHATKWMYLKNIMLSERNKTPKITYRMSPLTRQVVSESRAGTAWRLAWGEELEYKGAGGNFSVKEL